jgi:hypothetical protein
MKSWESHLPILESKNLQKNNSKSLGGLGKQSDEVKIPVAQSINRNCATVDSRWPRTA